MMNKKRQENKKIDNDIKKAYKDKHFRYERLYLYVSDLYKTDNFCYIRNCKNKNIVDKTLVGMIAFFITVATLCINLSSELLKDIGHISGWMLLIITVVGLAYTVLWIMLVVSKRQYIIGVIKDVEQDRKEYDSHGRTLNERMIEKMKQ